MTSSVHLQTIENIEKILENLRNNMASDMPLDQVLSKAERDLDTVNTGTYHEYASAYDAEDLYPEVDGAVYGSSIAKWVSVKSAIEKYRKGEETAAGTLTQISKRCDIPPAPRMDARRSADDVAKEREMKLAREVEHKDLQIKILRTPPQITSTAVC